jgi:hypothetical protein
VKLSRKNFDLTQAPAIKIVNLILVIAFALSAVGLSAGQQAANTINTIAGGGTTPTSPLSLDLPGPTAVLKDGQGNLYITAPASAYVFELTQSGTVQNYTGLGWGYFAGDGGPVGAANVGLVTDIVEDSLGNFYLTDIADSRIREVSNGIINTIIGNGTKCDIATGTNVCGDGGPITGANLNIPTSIALDSAGNVYITDTVDNRIRVANMSAKTPLTVAGTTIQPLTIQTIVGDGNACNIGTNPTCGDGGPASAAEVNNPMGIFVDATGDIFIADTHDHEIREIANALNGGATITAYAGQTGAACPQATSGCNDGSPATKGLLRLPQGIYLDANGNGYIADTGDNKARFVNVNTGIINTMAGTGVQGFAGDGAQAQLAELDAPNGIYVDSSSNIYLADTGNQRVRQFTLAGTIQTIAGGSLGDGPALSTQFANPYSVANSSGTIYFTDQANNRVRALTNNSGVYTVSTIAGTGSLGFSGDLGPATAATMNAPSGLALDSMDNLYFTDTNNLVIRQVNLSTGTIKTVAGTPGQGCPPPSGCGDGGPATSASFTGPLGIATDSAGNLYIADYFGYRVRAVNMGTTTTKLAGISIKPSYIATIAGNGTQGDCSFNKTCNVKAIAAGINHPGEPAVDSSGNVYFSDQWNNSVRVVSTSNVMTNYALGGKPGPTGDGGPASKGGMWNPLLVTLDPEGDLYISGGNDELVQRVDVSTTSLGGPHEIGTVVGNAGNATLGGFAGDGGPAVGTSVRINNLGSSVDGSGNLYIADAGNNRIRYVPLAAAGSPSVSKLNLGTWPIGQSGGGVPVRFTGTGGADLSLNSISVTGTNSSEFTATNNCGTFPALIGPQAKCTVTVSLTPSSYGAVSASLNFNDNGPNSPQTVALTGSGPDFTNAVSPNAIKVNEGQSGTSTITLTPVAKFNQQITLTCTGNPANSTCTITPSQVTLNGSAASTATLNIQTQSTTPVGGYTLVVTGTFQNLLHTANITLRVNK